MNYRLTALFDCIPLDCFWKTTKKIKVFLCLLMAKMMAQVVPVASFCRFEKKSTLKKLDCGSNTSFGFICLCGR